MSKLKYVIVIDDDGNECAIIFPIDFPHVSFSFLKPISAGIFDINRKNKSILILEGSSSLEIEPRYGIDEDVIIGFLSESLKYFIIYDNDLNKEYTFFIKDSLVSKKVSDVFNLDSSGEFCFFDNNINCDICSRLEIDKKIVSSVVNFGLVL